MKEGKLSSHLTEEPWPTPILILLISLSTDASLTKLALSTRHILWHLLQELMRFLGHSEAMEILSISTLFLTQSRFLPLAYMPELKNIHAPPSFLLLFKAQADSRNFFSHSPFFFFFNFKYRGKMLCCGVCGNGQ